MIITFSSVNIYKKPNKKSEVTTQILYGEKFTIIKKNSKWIKIKTNYDKYIGYIENKGVIKNFKPSKKISVLKAQIYMLKNKKFIKIKNKYLPFSARLKIFQKKRKFLRFEKNRWISINELENLTDKKKFFKVLKLFLNCKYKWGGRNFDGIDCSALVQMFYHYNNKYFPRDTNKQIKFKKGFTTKKKFQKGDLIFWRGHVAVCLNNSKLIHAYGPKKKVLIMPINKTIKLIEKTANLKIKKIFTI
tara:strand:- start:272 stop:1009 length:738 start_codon:yes stop_codon:yes gene_type:complete